ncbi:LD-carboxypeptidase [Prochlorococcus sp. MIT 1341]|uniref:S66 peptidase family protein n=1 Tax=Prochlorococcus sp. MIT 1341 TaxID=3096221 RepID=UPI002A75C8A2|nr:LD-carboxypeptidase [Prochlorococcus sp. MIT 1341]
MIKLLQQTIPASLKQGDEVAFAATASAFNDEDLLIEGTKVLQGWGLVCRSTNILNRRWRELAGEDEIRNKDLQPEPSAPLIACAKGGWGSSRLLELPQRWHTGWILGFSDVTSLLLARLSAGFHGCIHGPLITTLAAEPEWSKERLRCLLFGKPIPAIEGDPWSKGEAIGPLVVANLTVASHLLGSKFVPDLKGAILILEDIDEEPYRIDRMLTHWRLAGPLQQIAGLGFGNFKDCEGDGPLAKHEKSSLEMVLKERTSDLGIPVLGELPVGHLVGNAALPLGNLAKIDCQKGLLKLFP